MFVCEKGLYKAKKSVSFLRKRYNGNVIVMLFVGKLYSVISGISVELFMM